MARRGLTVDGHYWRTLLAGRWMATDGTGRKVLAPLRGTLTADADHRFNAVFATGHVVESGCDPRRRALR